MIFNDIKKANFFNGMSLMTLMTLNYTYFLSINDITAPITSYHHYLNNTDFNKNITDRFIMLSNVIDVICHSKVLARWFFCIPHLVKLTGPYLPVSLGSVVLPWLPGHFGSLNHWLLLTIAKVKGEGRSK